MQDAFRAFAAELIDYAGLFPPAELPLARALREDLGYRSAADAWMLGRFICPASRLAELREVERGLGAVPRFRVSALGRGGSDRADFLAGMRDDLAAIGDFERGLSRTACVEVLEVRVPAEVADGPSAFWRELLLGAGEAMTAAGFRGLRLYCELPAAQVSPANLARAAAGLAAYTHESGLLAGLKLRCGGVTAEAFPATEVVAHAVAACREHGTSFKATAGLHHPIRAYRGEVQTKMHGFVNLFGAALLAYEHALGTERIRSILECETASQFRFSGDRFGWRELEISAARIGALRETRVTSFGSCSFDEPRDDLRALGWME